MSPHFVLPTRLLMGLLALLLAGIGVFIDRMDAERHLQVQRSELQGRLAELSDRLNNLLISDLQLVRGLVSVINLDPALGQARFEQAVRPLLDGRTQLRNIGAAPDMVIRMMVPIEGNEAAIGLDYRKVPAQIEAAERARVTRQVVLAGPVPLVQGGHGLIARLPVYLEGDRFWGLVSAVIDSDRLFQQAGLTDLKLPFELAIRGADAAGADGRVFFGDAALFERRPVLADVQLPHGSWRLAAVPRGGWSAHAPGQWRLRVLYAGVALLVLLLFHLLGRALREASQARERAEAAQAQLGTALGELECHRQRLEDEVSQRTAQLAAAKDAAEAASVAKTQFLANMSHEIRTPLNAITGMAHLIRHDGLSPGQVLRMDTLESASSHLLQVINAILDLSKIEAGRFELSDEPVDVHALVARVALMLDGSAKAKGITLHTEVALPAVRLRGDGTRLQQALLNYAANAVRFTSRGGVVLRVSQADARAGRLCLRFEVQDSGIGIEPAALARLFNAFEQADNTSTREYGGTGLGLVITRKLARLMGGDAGGDSRPGQGSRFWFTAWLPRDDQAAALAQAAAPGLAAAPAPPRRVLLVEDDDVNRTIATFLLREMGHDVEVAEDGVQAVALAAARSYDLVLMDMQMPRMDGIEATRRIRALAGHGRTPIIAITANAFDQDRQACLAAGMDDFITKPLVPEQLRQVLQPWLQQAGAGAAPQPA
ncbi:response regulator [Pseudorhodoferax sp.]|uniref:response regulator n=1 Tax=Pseudorhodoferax sp. TaxID=1993553 RepID=UPI002DD65BCC|nr:response regulator [Pseudorhodoferax sp.]